MDIWLKALIGLTEGKNPVCPHCGKNTLDYGYVILNRKLNSGYGAIWCNNCNHAFCLSRIKLNGDEDSTKIISKLPEKLIF